MSKRKDRWFGWFMSALFAAALIGGALAFNLWWFDEWKLGVESMGCHVEESACRGCTPLTPPMRRYSTYWLRCEDGGEDGR